MNQALAREIQFFHQESSLNILLAEDDGNLRRLLSFVLRRDGHDVVEVADGADLLEALASNLLVSDRRPFDLVICEQRLPGIPGLTALAGVRSRDREMPFILITGDTAVQARARDLGAVILDRPFNMHAVRGAVRRSSGLGPAND